MLKVKICGITNLEDALLACNLGAWALGFNFYPHSSRYIHPETARTIIQQLPDNIICVGVFVNAELRTIEEVYSIAQLDLVQLHGNESEEYCNNLHMPFIKAFRFFDTDELEQLNSFRNAAYVLLDGYSPDCFGGSGICANLEISKIAQSKRNIILAGGLNAQNIQDTVEYVKPLAIDLCSGIEGKPGKKCAKKMFEFFNITKGINI